MKNKVSRGFLDDSDSDDDLYDDLGSDYLSLLTPAGISQPVYGYEAGAKKQEVEKVDFKCIVSTNFPVEQVELKDDLDIASDMSVFTTVTSYARGVKGVYDYGSGIHCRYMDVYDSSVHYDPLFVEEGKCTCGAIVTNKENYEGDLNFVAINSLQNLPSARVVDIVKKALLKDKFIFIMLPTKLRVNEFNHEILLDTLLTRMIDNDHIVYMHMPATIYKYKTGDGMGTSHKEECNVKSVVIFPDEQIIGSQFESSMDFPVCGSVETNETPTRCAVREMKEELGIVENIIYHGVVVVKKILFHVHSVLPGRVKHLQRIKPPKERGPLVTLHSNVLSLRVGLWESYIMVCGHYGIDISSSYLKMLRIDSQIRIPVKVLINSPNYIFTTTKELTDGNIYFVSSIRASMMVMKNGRVYGYLNYQSPNIYEFKIDKNFSVTCIYCKKSHESNAFCKNYYYVDNYIEFQNLQKKTLSVQQNPIINADYELYFVDHTTAYYPRLKYLNVGDKVRISSKRRVYLFTYVKTIIARLCDTAFKDCVVDTGATQGKILIMELRLVVE